MRVLVINSGSSSLKYAVFDAEPGEHERRPALTRGLVERVGSGEATLRRSGGAPEPINAPDHAAALATLGGLEDFSGVEAVGHRVVHGGESFTRPTLVTPEVVAGLEANVHLAPLHNPANIAGIRAAADALPGRPQVAVFDTGFHATMPERAYLYAIPRRLYEENRMRRYGFHGTSHEFVSREAARLLGRPLEELKLVSLHLGNGASACAVVGGQSLDTSMGFTPLEGLVMGTRSGDVDPALVLELARREGVEGALETLNTRSGMLGLAGASDMRDVHRAAEGGDRWARTALEVYAYRIRKTIGAYAAAMGGLDAVVFTAGVGENDASTRAAALDGLDFLGLELDGAANASDGPVITRPGSRAVALVVPTDEERAIAWATRELLEGG